MVHPLVANPSHPVSRRVTLIPQPVSCRARRVTDRFTAIPTRCRPRHPYRLLRLWLLRLRLRRPVDDRPDDGLESQRPSLEACLLGVWQDPFAWLVVVEPVASGDLE
ncbi:MAG: hypothetical protein ACRDUV_13235, partial [Pseudonocardiaceae bacterium]